MKKLVIIPAKNEAEKISEVIAGVKKNGYEVVVINDGSSDLTADKALSAGAIVLNHIINRGQGAALRTGIEYAKQNNYDLVIFFDADGQMSSEEIAVVAAPIENNEVEVVLGSRFLGKAVNISRSKLMTLKLALAFTRLTTGLKLSDTHNGFQAWSIDALNKIDLRQDRMAYASELLQEISLHKLKFKEVPVTIKYTSYSIGKGQSILNSVNILWDLLIKK